MLIRTLSCGVAVVLIACAVARGAEASAAETVWMEAETFGPLHGSNFSFQPVEKTTKGSWSVAGPGVAAEWTQGGESEWMSVAARADEPAEVVAGRGGGGAGVGKETRCGWVAVLPSPFGIFRV